VAHRPTRSISYGKLIRDAYEFWFGRAFEKERLRIQGALEGLAGGYRGGLEHDVTTDLFPLLVVQRPHWDLILRLQPSFRGKERFDVAVTYRTRRLDPKEAPFPVLNCLSHALLERDLGAPWMDTVETGTETFDARFLIRVLPGGDGRTALTPRVRNGLLGLYFAGGTSPNLWFECQSNFVRVKRTMQARDIAEETRRPLCRRTLAVFLEIERLLLDRHGPLPGVLLGAGDEAAVCKICGEWVMARAVRCVACETTHHQECFDYAGVCAIYGCGAKRYHAMLHR